MENELVISLAPEPNPAVVEMEFMAAEKPVVLITGIAGLIGARLAEACAAHYRVVGLDVRRPPQEANGADFIECDLTDGASAVSALATLREMCGARVASVIHLAAHCDFSGAPSPLYRTLTVEGTRRLLRGLRDFEVEQFVFSSALLVMKPAEGEDEIITEWSPEEEADKTWDYPRSKIEAERVIKQEWRRGRGNIPVVILRIAGVYNEDCRSVPIAWQISRIYEKKLESYFFSGDAGHGQSFTHLDDLVDAFLRVIELRHELGQYEVFLIAEPDVMSYAELQDQIGELLYGAEWPTIRIPKMVAKAGAWAQENILGIWGHGTSVKPRMLRMADLADTRCPVEIERARNRLGWEPRHRLRNTLNDLC